MDVKVYQKEEVLQPSGVEYVYVPNVIDIIPDVLESEAVIDLTNHKFNVDQLKYVADVKFENHKLIIKCDSNRIRVADGKLYIRMNDETILNCQVLDDNSKELLEQQCALATIWQRGLDPLDLNDGVRWSEAILEELSCLQLIQDITEAVAKVTSSIKIVFDTVEDENGQQYLSYKLLEAI